MSVRSGQAVTTEFTTRIFATGVAANADSLPTGVLYVNGTADAAVVTVTNQATGRYKASVTLPTLAVGDLVSIIITATISGITDNSKIWEDERDSGFTSSGSGGGGAGMSGGGIADISEVLLQLGLSGAVTETERAITSEALRAATAAVVSFLQYNPVLSTHIEFYPQYDFRIRSADGIWEANDTQAYLRQLSESVTNELQLKHIPIRSIESLWIDYDGRFGKRSGSFGASTEKTEGVDFWAQYDMIDSGDDPVCSDGIIRSEGRWPDTPGTVRIEYTAGYSDAELHGQDTVINASAILEAVIDETVRRVLKINSRMKTRLAGFSGPFASESLGDYSYSVDGGIRAKLIGGTSDLLHETQQKLMSFTKCDMGVM